MFEIIIIRRRIKNVICGVVYREHNSSKNFQDNIDATQAFDTLNHNRLLAKLAKFGFDKSTLQWFIMDLDKKQTKRS